MCRRARSANERAHHLTIRHQIFVDEQAVFPGSDLDPHDGEGSTIAVLGYSDSFAVGTVRLFPLHASGEHWQGDRLAVLPPYRALGVGAPLVRYAVATAGALGGQIMTAHVQPDNVVFFERLGWTRVGRIEIYAGLPHQPMSIDLPSRSDGQVAVERLENGVNGPGPSPH